ncbi:class IV adenylate cyclase [Chitinivorax sp. B]|uniref:class IV adenylate cyclase n=1 Tax=Chitinivorax sp. B TaxID=2502235 RepID=UPI0010F88670|nr:class IV adenylate cyclase [Chitinivorax sp. B]
MARNIEIKARVTDRAALLKHANVIAGQPAALLQQRDTFFLCQHGRLKLRVLQPGQGQLIHYHRADQQGPKLSDYRITDIDQPDALRNTLSMALGILGEVIKQRILYLVGQTRIHIDQVDGLGDFMELEVVLRDDQTAAEGEAIALALMQQLGIHADDLIEVAYLDLLLSPEIA